MPWFNGRPVARQVQPFWSVRKNSGQFGQTRPVGRMAGLENEKERALCQQSRVQPVTALMPTDRNAGHQKWQYLAAMPTQAIRLTIVWQRDMIINPVGRRSGRSTFRHANRQDRDY